MNKLVSVSRLAVCLTVGATVAAISPVSVEARAAAPTASPASTPATSEAQRLREGAAKEEKREATQRLLELAETYAMAGAWDQAIEAYAKVADSADHAAASKARAELLNALKAKDAGALGLRDKLPPPLNHWWFLDYVAYAIGAAVAVILAIPIVAIGSRLLQPIIRRIFKRSPSKSPWRVSLIGTAEEPDRSMVLDEFLITMRSLGQSDRGESALSSVGFAAVPLFTPFSLADLVGPDLVIQGVDVSRIAAIMQRFVDYFSYGFELRVDKSGRHAYVYASLRWGGRVEKSWQIPSITEATHFNFREIGRQLAFAIYGDGLIRR